jgi:ABC-2 type transport system permease protein
MRKVLVIAVREYLAAVRTKAFIVGLVIMPVMMSGSLVLQWLLRDYHDIKEKRFAVVDRTPNARLLPPLQEAVRQYNEHTRDPATGKQVQPHFTLEQVPASADTPDAVGEQREQLSERVRQGELFGFLEIGPRVFEPGSEVSADGPHMLRYQSNRPTHQIFPRLAKEALASAITDIRIAEAGLPVSPRTVKALVEPVPLREMGLSRRDPATGRVEDASEQSRLAPVAVPLGLMMLMFMVIMMGATPLMQGVVEEKMQRIAEVLLGSVRPFDLMLGKLLGMTAVSLTMATVYLGGTLWAAHRYGFAEYIPGSVLAWFLLFQALATLMYGSLFIAIGAACTEMHETQNLMWPVMLLVVAPMFVLGSVLQEPNSAVATALSFFPFATPTIMIVRLAVPPGLEVWQPLLGVLLVLATTLLCVYAAGRIFRVGILLQGKGARLGDMMRWVFRS